MYDWVDAIHDLNTTDFVMLKDANDAVLAGLLKSHNRHPVFTNDPSTLAVTARKKLSATLALVIELRLAEERGQLQDLTHSLALGVRVVS